MSNYAHLGLIVRAAVLGKDYKVDDWLPKEKQDETNDDTPEEIIERLQKAKEFFDAHPHPAIIEG